MKFVYSLLFVFAGFYCSAQTSADYVVQLTATVQKSPAQITLKWKPAPGTNSYVIYRKAKNAISWGNSIATVNSATTTYTDVNVTVGETYEYHVLKSDEPSHGYILAGIEAAPIHTRGALLLLVDSTFTDSCKTELTQLMKDISGDGWEVLRKDYNRAATVASIKGDIVSTYQSNPSLKAVFIVGHIAVPYSGNYDSAQTGTIAPDGHKDHAGAWPADMYYGDMDGTWTDAVTNEKGTRAANKNYPGDGKFDQSQIPSDIELQVSRVDFFNMPTFTKTEVQLMRNYLAKDHSYKSASLQPIHRALIDDNFGKMNGEGFAAAAYRLSPLLGPDSIKNNMDFIPTLNANSYQWALGCGGGSFTTCSGVGATADFKTNNVKGIFTILFGSYFGDWNVQNNFLRAPLCAPDPALTSCWSGRPHFFFHQMSMGDNIGYSSLATQNNGYTYENKVNIYPRFIHPALMGDLTLRTEYILPASALTLASDPAAGAKLSWTASTEPGVAGYYVYRATSEYGEYKLRSGLVTGTSYNDSFGNNGTYWYMVRAAKLHTTPSGSYNNLSLGITQSAAITYPYFEVGVEQIALLSGVKLYPNPAQDVVQVEILTTQTGKAQISVTNMQGVVLTHSIANLGKGKNVHSINTAALPQGMYLVHINTGKEEKVLKLAKAY